MVEASGSEVPIEQLSTVRRRRQVGGRVRPVPLQPLARLGHVRRTPLRRAPKPREASGEDVASARWRIRSAEVSAAVASRR